MYSAGMATAALEAIIDQARLADLLASDQGDDLEFRATSKPFVPCRESPAPNPGAGSDRQMTSGVIRAGKEVNTHGICSVARE